jgi:hypothetical protein
VTPEATISTVVKNKSTERNREFWSHVETIAEQSRTNRAATTPHSPPRIVHSKTHDDASKLGHTSGSGNCQEKK